MHAYMQIYIFFSILLFFHLFFFCITNGSVCIYTVPCSKFESEPLLDGDKRVFLKEKENRVIVRVEGEGILGGMPWYLSTFRVSFCAIYSYLAYLQLRWIAEAEERYRRSLTWKPAVATIFDHNIVMKRGGSSHVQYRFVVGGKEYVGDRFRSGGIHKEEMVSNPALLGAGTQLVVYHNPADPNESAIKLQTDRGAESVFLLGIAVSLLVSYRSVRCETILPNMFYTFLGVNRRLGGITGLKEARTHSKQKMRYGKETGAI
ncbi:hypothetical protein, conserved [Trypanosoma cruzi]|uniref:DUF3592 domain-containing protein n=2 Tax=Trypanosoma cruzi TaxID=5693 RepID=Q4CX01_TRYCC|nr:hypothetical protein, conserved [Trypanosoma cruzi]EAN84803.1 hypothetical protein, conserved [Trypanosoma cruzi]|eukprot:XP_806654.1 hypothetical protein [Trypanosoma cruzi strain CL Brener]